ncbi:glycosyltransferase family 4 protein [Microscilla marina]|uniref:Glycosyl transferase, group 1, putative n=1 Tax=Microscilla marina ATCC 23134 TaxID=313606 RepID=A1ZSQ2_MICM2|nr:glycosyltransferase family 4 protein [Microscilla marina]EAY26632.1 glycosyl transferase, group 1, putative [Microscilla marina ATCC 23134]
MTRSTPTQLRILWLTENYYPNKGGMAQSCDRIVHHLRADGVLVDVVHFTNHLTKTKVVSVQNGKNIAFAMHPDVSHSLNLVWSFIENYNQELAQAQSPAITHLVAFGGQVPMLAAPIFAAWLRLPYVVLLRGNDFDTGIFSPKRQEILKNALLNAAHICVVSKDKMDKIKGLFSQARVSHIANGIDLNEWQLLASDKKKAQEWRNTHVTQVSTRKVWGMFGHLKSKKGVLFFLEALKLSGKLPQVHLLIIGDMTEAVAKFLEANTDILHYTHYPFMERYALLPYYAACDLVAIPSYYDGLPNVMMEAGGLGMPFIAAKAGGMGDFLEEGVHGHLFHPGNLDQCREAINQMFTLSADELQKMGANCKQMVQTQLNHHDETANYRQMFENTLSLQKKASDD